MVDTRFSRLDTYRLRWFPFTEANFGAAPVYATDVSKWLGIVTEVSIMNDPEFEPLWGLEPLSDGEAGSAFAILDYRPVAKVKFSWYQQTLASPYRYWLKDFLKKPSADNYTNFWLNLFVNRTDTECMSWFWKGCKVDSITVRGEAGENKPILWSAECLAKEYDTGVYRGTNSFEAANSNPPWRWSDVNLTFSTDGSSFNAVPEAKSFELTLRNHLYANYTFQSDGSMKVLSLEHTKYEAKLSFRMNMRNVDWYNYMKNSTTLWFRLNFPDSKIIALKKCKITGKPVFNPDMETAQMPVEVIAQEWDHNW
jgi:hypothetical protein